MALPSDYSHFFGVYTDFQCMIIAQLNKMDFNGISATHYNVIEYLYRNGPSTATQLAKKFCISLPAISRQVKLLLERKLIIQKQHKTDRRMFYLEVTAKGRKLVNDSEHIRKNISVAITDILDKKELHSFTRLCAKVVAHMQV
jgi:DNA-binding MarR family transcriptional regulator